MRACTRAAPYSIARLFGDASDSRRYNQCNMPRKSCFLLCVLLPASAWAQHLSIGVTGGIGLTDAFTDQTFNFNNAIFHNYSGAKDYLVGPAIQVSLPFGLAVEFDALYRPLHLANFTEDLFIPSFRGTTQSTLNTWEFPLLAKYSLPGHLIRPFVETGPSFRHAGTNASLPNNVSLLSNHGFTAGGGGEIHVWKLRIAPEIRYTRWAADNVSGIFGIPLPASQLNQAELLVGLWF